MIKIIPQVPPFSQYHQKLNKKLKISIIFNEQIKKKKSKNVKQKKKETHQYYRLSDQAELGKQRRHIPLL